MPTLSSSPTTVPPPRRSSERRRVQQRRQQLFTRLLAVIALAALLVSWRYRLVWVVGDSMLPTYRTGDLLVVDKRAYHGTPPSRDDVIVARHHNELIVKRVVGLPGEQIAVSYGRVQVNGVAHAARHDVQLGLLDIAPGRLLSDRYAVLGDNRSISPSLFVHAIVGPEQIVGRVVWGLRR
jgi:signal peptidase I